MKPITHIQRKALLVELHKIIKARSSEVATRLARGSVESQLAYPPNGSLTSDEAVALKKIKLDATTEKAFAKVIADASASVVFDFFCVMDGVADPTSYADSVWLGAQLAEPDDSDHTFMHDALYETYQDYQTSLDAST